jgi:hypothetical protein
MTKPTPEQFGLTTETVTSLTEEHAQREKRRKDLDWNIIKALWFFASVVYVTYNLAIGRDYVTLLVYAIGFVTIGFMMTLASSLVLPYLSYLIFPDLPSYRHLKHFQDAVAQYEAWLPRTQGPFGSGSPDEGSRSRLQIY